MRRLGTVVALPVAALVLVGCTSVPQDAQVKAFCSEGEKFSASTSWTDGVKAAKKLQQVGTPAGIGGPARSGFVELVNRMLDAKSGGDFRERTKKLDAAERKHLVALSTYIRKTCDLGGAGDATGPTGSGS